MPEESALIVPAPQLIPLVEEIRRRFDPTARAGVPPHVTLMYPFLEPALLSAEVLGALDGALSSIGAFSYSVVDVREFEGGVLYLAPEPAQAFVALTRRIGEMFQVAPYGGVHDAVVPHVTIAQSADEWERADIVRLIEPSLPQHGMASEAWLMLGDNEKGWRKVRAMSFAVGSTLPPPPDPRAAAPARPTRGRRR